MKLQEWNRPLIALKKEEDTYYRLCKEEIANLNCTQQNIYTQLA